LILSLGIALSTSAWAEENTFTLTEGIKLLEGLNRKSINVVPENQSNPSLAVEAITRGVERSIKTARGLSQSSNAAKIPAYAVKEPSEVNH